ncbi:MAG: hypothetical protein ACLQIB_47485 [Isosphaeraceae bacterium]
MPEPTFKPRASTLTPGHQFADSISTARLKVVLARLLPTWDKFRIDKSIHALRLWGHRAVFDINKYPSPFGTRVFTGRELLTLFLDDAFFRAVTRGRAEPLSVLTNDGVRLDYSPSVSFVGGLGHIDKLLRVCGELGITAETGVRTRNGESNVGQILQYAVSHFDLGQELEWSLEALARYLVPLPGWTNRFGETFTFDKVTQYMCDRRMGEGACFGTHLPYTLCVVLGLDRRENFLSRSIARRAEEHLRSISGCLETHQTEDGTWPHRWAAGTAASRSNKDDSHFAALTLVGHHLEWIAIAPPECRPSERCVRKAIAFALDVAERLPTAEINNNYHLFTHIGRALCLLAGVEVLEAYRVLLHQEAAEGPAVT